MSQLSCASNFPVLAPVKNIKNSTHFLTLTVKTCSQTNFFHEPTCLLAGGHHCKLPYDDCIRNIPNRQARRIQYSRTLLRDRSIDQLTSDERVLFFSAFTLLFFFSSSSSKVCTAMTVTMQPWIRLSV